MRALWVLLLVAGCTDDKYLVVTVDARPAVHDADSLIVTLSNGGTSRMDTLPLGGHAFPVTFSVTAPGRSGQLAINIEAQTSDMEVVGAGAGSATIGATAATVMLDSTDFVVNTDYAMDQFLNQDYETNGFQLASTSDGHWTAAFRDSCNAGACTIFGRTFDQDGKPANTAAAAGTNAYAFTSTLTQQGAMPAVAASGTSTLAFWDYADTVGGGVGVACRAIDGSGNLSASQLSVSTDAPDTVGAAHLSNDNVAVTWQIYTPNLAVRSVIVKPDCTTLGPVVTVSTTQGATSGPHRAAAASNGSTVLYTWLQDGDVHTRIGSNTALTGNDTTIITHQGTLEVAAVRPAAMGTGFAVAVRWADTSGTGPGKIELYQVSSTGMVVGSAQLVTDQSLSDFASGQQSFGIATNAAGRTMIVWHVCDSSGTAGSCDVFGRFAKADGTMDGDVFGVPTNTTGDQIGPSVAALPVGFAVAWTDTSHVAPDTAGSAVRARVYYPAN
jgi:hypothetical protein